MSFKIFLDVFYLFLWDDLNLKSLAALCEVLAEASAALCCSPRTWGNQVERGHGKSLWSIFTGGLLLVVPFYPQQQGFASLKVSKWRANHMDLSNMSMCPQDIGLKPMVSPLVGDIISIHFHFQVWVVMVYHYVQPSLIHQLQFPLRISYAVSAIRSHSVWISRKTP